MMDANPNCPEENGPDFDHGSSMILVDLPDGGQVLTAGHKNGTVFGLDPDNAGAALWATKIGRGSIQGGVHFGMAADGTTVYAPINDMNNTYNGDVLDPDAARPGMHAIDASSGRILWSTVQKNVCPTDLQYCDPGISAAVSAVPGAVFAGHLDGFVRAYDRDTGAVLWEFDTKTPVVAVNGIEARGGGMSGAVPGRRSSTGTLSSTQDMACISTNPATCSQCSPSTVADGIPAIAVNPLVWIRFYADVDQARIDAHLTALESLREWPLLGDPIPLPSPNAAILGRLALHPPAALRCRVRSARCRRHTYLTRPLDE